MQRKKWLIGLGVVMICVVLLIALYVIHESYFVPQPSEWGPGDFWSPEELGYWRV